jgi:two-component system LytT family sensor kinase
MTSYALLQLLPSRRMLGVWEPGEIQSGLSSLSAGAMVAFLVYRFVRRVPWPRRLGLSFLLINLVAAIATTLLWIGLSIAFESLFTGSLLNTRTGTLFWRERISMGLLLYAVIAAITYPVEASARAARAESLAARTQLAALRAQIQPHFLFNALHTVVQLIPLDPNRAVEAAELIADLLRATVDESRDEVTLDEEWRFVSRYLALERIRFGDRLVIRSEFAEGVLEDRVPAFALQTLVENAVRHGAARRVAATEIALTASGSASELTLSVRNTDDGAHATGRTAVDPSALRPAGTGLARLRERLAALYGDAARLECGPTNDCAYEALLVVPRNGPRNAARNALRNPRSGA